MGLLRINVNICSEIEQKNYSQILFRLLRSHCGCFVPRNDYEATFNDGANL